MTIRRHLATVGHTPLFPPALVPFLRDRMRMRGPVAEVSDQVLIQLLTTVFWAGLETYEGERNPIGVAFVGTSPAGVVTSEATGLEAPLLYQWKVQHFTVPRPFAVDELVKLAVAGTDRRIYSAVNVLADGSLAIGGLAREGFNVDPDPFFKIIASRPGCLTVRRGRDLLLEYDRGTVLTGAEDIIFTAGPVRRALESTAHAADLDDEAAGDYVEAVRSLVREIAAHGRGGLLVVSLEDQPAVADAAPYRVALDSSVASLIKLARRLGMRRPGHRPSRAGTGEVAFGSLLRNAFLTEVERLTEELGALTAIDGAVLLNRHLALVAFGVMLPLGRPTPVAEARNTEGAEFRLIDLASRGTRHHAGATYAADHPGSVVFVASEDGHVSCMVRDPAREHTLVWRLGPADVRGR